MTNELNGVQAPIGLPVDSVENAKVEKFDNVNHPSHYVSHPSGVETINITREFEFTLGNAWKYLMRFRYKGKPKEDLEKAVWYMNDYMSHRDLYAEFSVKHNNEKTENLINNASKVIAAEKIPEVKHAMRAILEQALFGRNVVCDFIKAKVELEAQVEKIATSLVLGDEFDVASANTMIAADELLQRISEVETGEKLRAEEAKKAEETAELEKVRENSPADEWLADHSFNNDEAISVTVDDKTHTVIPSTVELDPKRQYHTEIVKLPAIVASLERTQQREWAENYVANQLAMTWPRPESVAEVTETPAETPDEKPKKKRRKKKTSV